MALREFRDSRGVAWTVWSIAEDAVHPRTRNEDLLREYAFGWLCFESSTGEKRRLLDYPDNWEQLPDRELEALCGEARPGGIGRLADQESSRSAPPPDPSASGTPAEEQMMAAAESEERRRRGEGGPGDAPRRRQGDTLEEEGGAGR